jgi:hypothetical protein
MGYLLQEEVRCEGHCLIVPSLAYDNTVDPPTEEISVVYFRPLCLPPPLLPRFHADILLCGDAGVSRPSGQRPHAARHSVIVDSCVLLVRRNLAIGIAIQNFPEGLAVSLPLQAAGFSTMRSFL